MPYKLIATKGRMKSESISKKKILITNRAKRLRADGWRTKVYKVR